MKKGLFFLFVLVLSLLPRVAVAQTSPCDTITLPYFEDFYSDDGTLPDCWVYDGSYVKWNNYPNTSGNGELMFGAYSAAQPAVLPKFTSSVGKLGITFKTKCGTIDEGDAILIGVADDDGTLLQWIDTIFDADHSRNAWVWHTYLFTRYFGNGSRIALGRLWNTTGEHWVAIDDVEVFLLPSCYSPENLQASNLDDPANTIFSWENYGDATQWQVYCDTITATIDTVDDSRLILLDQMEYTIPEGLIIGGGKYRFYVRSVCYGDDFSPWVSYEFGAGTYVMNNTGTFDVVSACGLVVYDNGGPVAGYLENSNSALVIYPEGLNNQLEVYGAIFGFGATGASLSIYDGVGTSGSPLYTYNVTSGNDTLNEVIATSTLGALTITFTSTGNMAHTGYELYIRCTQQPSCPRPTNFTAEPQSLSNARLSWTGDAANYMVYHRRLGTGPWSLHTIDTSSILLTGLLLDTQYEAYVLAVCTPGDTSRRSAVIHFRTPDTDIDPSCEPIGPITVDQITPTSARIAWVSSGHRWSLEYNGQVVSTTLNPITLDNLNPQTQYDIRLRNICDNGYSPWSETVRFSTPLTAGISDVDAQPLVLYPNPATDHIVVPTSDEGGFLTIVDAIGRQVLAQHLAAGNARLSLTSLTPGIYLVRLVAGTTTRTCRLVIR